MKMNRREVMQVLGAGTVAAAMPVAAKGGINSCRSKVVKTRCNFNVRVLSSGELALICEFVSSVLLTDPFDTYSNEELRKIVNSYKFKFSWRFETPESFKANGFQSKAKRDFFYVPATFKDVEASFYYGEESYASGISTGSSFSRDLRASIESATARIVECGLPVDANTRVGLEIIGELSETDSQRVRDLYFMRREEVERLFEHFGPDNFQEPFM